jgi:hypothetical protein
MFSNVDYSMTSRHKVCPKGAYYSLDNKCEWFDYSEKEDLEFTDAVLVVQIRYNCPYRTKDFPSEEFARFLLQVEREAGFPPEVRGLLAAFACKESGYRYRALGDRKFSKTGKYPKARGMYQLWGWAKKHVKKLYQNDVDKIQVRWWKRVPLNDFRDDPVYTSIYIAQHIARHAKKAGKECNTRNIERIWRIAEARVARGRSKLRCRDTTSHFKLMKRWHKIARSYEYY